ncbi:phosphoribulokinase [Acidiphilium sp.]|uniref:phosphoribulokinase n=1 Tax=Acidiphilium sp. TaxID=527 RepID=UPI003D02FD9E
MSRKHPIISVTGSSGAGTTSVRNIFEQIFRRENIEAAQLEGDSFHRYDRAEMKAKMAEAEAAGNRHFSHFSPETNLLAELQETFATYAATGRGKCRHYIHDQSESEKYGAPPGTFTPWEDLPEHTDILLYEGLHGAVKHGDIDTGKHADIRIGVVPVINLEWIQKIHRDSKARHYSTEAVMDTILRRMPDYVHYICPQFTETDINFQRVPTVDTSNPFVARWIPTADESIVVVRFRNPHGIDFPYLLSMLHGSFMSRANSIAVPGNKFDLAMQLILTPVIMQLMDQRKRAVR